MNFLDLLILVLLALWLGIALRAMFRRRSRGCGGCAGCSGACAGCSQAKRKT